MPSVHSAVVCGILLYGLPVLYDVSTVSEQKRCCALARSLRICLGVPCIATSRMILAEAREPPVEALCRKETVRQYLRLLVHHDQQPFVSKIHRWMWSGIYQRISAVRLSFPDFVASRVVSPTAPWTF